MEFLRLLEDLRTPVGDFIFSGITILGEETFFIFIGILFYWCISKRQGYYLLSVGLTGVVLNQFLKLLFRIPRPWVLDENFTIVESAREAASGYSFPSGHTQSAVGIFSGIFRWSKNNIVRILCAAFCILVPVSRMYLGVHTPLDVGVSCITAIALVLAFYPLFHSKSEEPRRIRIAFACMTVFSVIYLAFIHIYNFPADVDAANLASGTKNAYTMFGCITGIWLAYEIESRCIKFDPKSKWYVQIIKLALGMALLMAIKSGAKAPLQAVLANDYLADGIRYFLITIFAGAVWPLTFKYFSKLERK